MFTLDQPEYSQLPYSRTRAAASRSRERPVFEPSEQRLFLQKNNSMTEPDSQSNMNNTIQSSSAWPNDLYFENQEGKDPLKTQVVDRGLSSAERISQLLDIAGSPIRTKVSRASLNPPHGGFGQGQGGRVQKALAMEDLSQLGPVSRAIGEQFKEQLETENSLIYPDRIHTNEDPDPVNDSFGTMEPSTAKRNYDYVGNREQKEYMHRAFDIYENSQKSPPRISQPNGS